MHDHKGRKTVAVAAKVLEELWCQDKDDEEEEEDEEKEEDMYIYIKHYTFLDEIHDGFWGFFLKIRFLQEKSMIGKIHQEDRTSRVNWSDNQVLRAVYVYENRLTTYDTRVT